MGLLDGGIASVMASAFSGLYLDGTLIRRTLTDDGKGGYVAADQAGIACKVQVDAATEAMRAQDGYTGTDVRLLILASGLEPVTTDHEIIVGSARYAIASVAQDPARSYFDCRGRVL